MTITQKLREVFLVDRQLQGLQGRLRAAERFLDEQNRQYDSLQTQHESLGAQVRQLQAAVHNHETEIKSFDDRIEVLRERMNSANTQKEYKALLTEVNTLKADRSELEEKSLEQIEKLDELKARIEQIETDSDERKKVREVATGDRDARASEIAERVEELKAERARLVKEVPTSVLTAYEQLLEQREEEAMANVEIQDKRRHEFTCGSCMMTIPVESVSALLSHGNVTNCVSCGCILYLTDDVIEVMKPAAR